MKKAVLGIVVLAVLWFAGRSLGGAVLGFAEWVEGLGAIGPLVFIAGYAIATVAFVPGSVLTLAAGAIFGLGTGVVSVFLGAVLGSTAAFLVSRHGARSFVEHRIEGDARFAAIDRAIAREGRRIVFLLRLSPAFPYNLLNYALGLTSIGLRDYVLAAVGMLPATVLYVYYGTIAGEVAAVASGGGAQRDAGYYATLAIGLVATVAVTAIVTRTARRALDEATREAPETA
jgi:uncharacterized membrane protein YdjX (TVP38/TMEM64 family)